MLAGRDLDVTARVRAALAGDGPLHDGPVGGGAPRAGAAVRRARHDRRRARAVLAALVVVAAAAVLVATTGPGREDAPVAPAAAGRPLSDPLSASSLLDLDQVSTLVPGVSGRAPAADVTPPTAGGYPRARYRGGWCGDTVLLDAPPPEQVWVAEWEQEGLAGTTATRGPAGAVREVVLRWPDAAGARAWAEAVHASPTRCRDPRGAPFPLRVFRPWTVSTSARSMTSVAVAPASAGPPVPPGSPVWRVRGVHTSGTTVVDLTAVVRAREGGAAVRSTTVLLRAAAARAALGERGGRG